MADDHNADMESLGRDGMFDRSGTAGAPREPFVDADAVAVFLSDTRDSVLKLTRAGKINGYPYKGTQRHSYRYLLSEVAEDMEALRKPAQRTISPAAPVSRRTKSNG